MADREIIPGRYMTEVDVTHMVRSPKEYREPEIITADMFWNVVKRVEELEHQVDILMRERNNGIQIPLG